jgi:CheY-like chemotaxis protein
MTVTEAPNPPSPPNCTILLVEDESVVREITRDVLEQAGYSVLEACGPEEAIQVAANPDLPIHLLLTDLVMRGMDGLALAAQLRRLHPELITILMSGYAAADVLGGLAGSVITTYIQKPFTVDTLCSQLSRAIAARSRENIDEEFDAEEITVPAALWYLQG